MWKTTNVAQFKYSDIHISLKMIKVAFQCFRYHISFYLTASSFSKSHMRQINLQAPSWNPSHLILDARWEYESKARTRLRSRDEIVLLHGKTKERSPALEESKTTRSREIAHEVRRSERDSGQDRVTRAEEIQPLRCEPPRVPRTNMR